MAMSLNQQLIKAAEKGNLEKVENLLRQGADIHASNDCAVRKAASYGHLDAVRFLYGKGADIRAKDDWAVRGAARKGQLDVVRFLHPLRLVRTPDGVRAQRTNLGQSEKGSDIHAADHYGPDAAVCWAAQKGHLPVVRFLVENGAYIHATDIFGPDAAVRGAARFGHLAVVRFLIKNGADIHAADRHGPDDAVRDAAKNGHLNVVRFLHPLRLVRTPDEVRAQRTNLGQSKKGADIRALNDYTVRWAARNGHLDVVRFLVPLRLGERRTKSERNAPTWGKVKMGLISML